MFASLLFTPSHFKNFYLLAKHKDFDFVKATHPTLNIIYIKLIYIKSYKTSYSTQNKNYFEKFIEELDFAELPTQAKHLRV